MAIPGADLSLLVDPDSVAVIGASDRPHSIGQRVVTNLLEHSAFEGNVYLVNAARSEVAGRTCWPNLSALPETPDLIIVAVPAEHVLQVLQEAGSRGVKFAIILSSGFGEAGESGKAAQLQMAQIAKATGMRLYGPNCPGLCNINKRLGFTFSPSFQHDLQSGPIGLVTQGGGLGRNVMQAMTRGFGVGLWASTGNEVDLQVADFIEYMAYADDIKVIVTLMEGIKDGKRFVRALMAAAEQGKPVIGLKVGRSEYGRKAAQSHTASMTGEADINSAVFRQLGLIEVDDIDELVDTAWLLARARPGNRKDLAIYCSSGGTSALSADLVGQAGLKLATFTDQTLATLASKLPDYAAIHNPVDTTTAILSNPEIVDETMLAVANDASVGLVMLPITLDYGSTTVSIAESAVRVQRQTQTPILPVWMTDRIGDAFGIYAKAGMVPTKSLGKAVKAIARWQSYGEWLSNRDPGFKPLMLSTLDGPPKVTRTLSEPQGKAWLRQAGIRVPDNKLCTSAEQCVEAANHIGYPVVAKVASQDIQHKSDVGGVFINLLNDEQVRQAWQAIHENVARHAPDAVLEGVLIEAMLDRRGMEVIVAVTRDPVLGHIMTFGLGGIHVEIFKDVSRAMLPLTPSEAQRMIREIKSYPLLNGARNHPRMDIEAIEALMLKLSQAVADNADLIEEVEINPVWVGTQGHGACALDAVVVQRIDDGASQ